MIVAKSPWFKLRYLMLFILVATLFSLVPRQAAKADATCGGPNAWYGVPCFQGYFTGNGATTGDDVISGGVPAGAYTSSGAFVGYVAGSRSAGGWSGGLLGSADPQLATAGQFIILTMTGHNAGTPRATITTALIDDWAARVQAATMQVDNLAYVCGSITTYYQYAPVNDIAAGSATGSEGCGNGNGVQAMLDFYSGGRLVYQIRISCGNPLGGLPGLPAKANPTDKPPVGSITTSCFGDETGRVSMSFHDPDVAGTNNSTGYITVGAWQSSLNTSPYIRAVPAANVAASWTAYLYVRDIGPVGDNAYHLVDTQSNAGCAAGGGPVNPDVVGHAVGSCTQLSGWMFDRAQPGTDIQYYVVDKSSAGLTSIPAGGHLEPNQSWTSPNGGVHLDMQADGNLVLRNADNTALWNTGTPGNPGSHFDFQATDGNMVIRKANGTVVWSGAAHGVPINSGAASLSIQDDGNMVIRNGGGGAIWTSQTQNRTNGKFSTDGAHNFSVNPATIAGWNPATSHTYAVFGVSAVANYLEELNDVTVGPCVPTGTVTQADCTAISGQAFDSLHPGALQVHFYVGATSAQSIPTDGEGNFSFTPTTSLSGFNNWDGNTVTVRAVSGGSEYTIGTVNIGPCVSVGSCGNGTFPATMSVGQPVAGFTVAINFSSGPPPGPVAVVLTATITGPGGFIQNFSNVPYSFTPTTPTTLVSAPITGFTPPTAGEYDLTWSVGGVAAAVCGFGQAAPGPGNFVGYAGYQPYFRQEAGDISAGAGFGTGSCPTVPAGGADISGSNAGYFGSGSGLGALLTGKLNGFATATKADGSLSASNTSGGQPNGLAFGNAASPAGAFFAPGTKWCVPDYYAAASGTLNPASIDWNKSGSYSFSGKPAYSLDAKTLGLGAHITLKITGDLYITGDLKYSNYTGTNVTAIPQLQVLVSGNIYIDPNVTELHGFYVAEKNGATKGGIYTCFSATARQRLLNAIGYASCGNPLTFYGAVAADQLYLDRVHGSVYANGLGPPQEPAETFQYSPELWAGDLGSDSAASNNAYQSIESLPPVL